MNKETLFSFSFVDKETGKVNSVFKYNTKTTMFRDGVNNITKPMDKETLVNELLNA